MLVAKVFTADHVTSGDRTTAACAHRDMLVVTSLNLSDVRNQPKHLRETDRSARVKVAVGHDEVSGLISNASCAKPSRVHSDKLAIQRSYYVAMP